MDDQNLRLPRPALWASHKRRINMDSIESPNTVKSVRTNKHSHQTNIKIGFSSPDRVPEIRPQVLIIGNPMHQSHYPQDISAVSPTTIHKLTSANLATFDESLSYRDRSGTAAAATSSSTNINRNPTTVMLNGTTTTDASDEYRLTMESIIHLSSSPISMPSAMHSSSAIRHYSNNNNNNYYNNNNRHAIDTNSVASSTHFTLVNGFGAMKHQKPLGSCGRRYCCCKPIAALIITMTVLLALIVFLMIFVIEYPRMTLVVQ